MFQSTRPRGARLAVTKIDAQYIMRFNPRARVGRDVALDIVNLNSDGSFNPRARVGRDLPTPDPVVIDGLVSIHAPAWGATTDEAIGAVSLLSFNPRARVGRDPAKRKRECGDVYVSIHAPAWGATDAAVVTL